MVGVRGQPPADGTLVYIGTYTGAKSKGIHAFRFNQATGALTPIGLVAETPSPSWLVLHPSGQYLYAANEVDDFDADKSGSVSAFRIDRVTGALTLLNTQPSRGAHPCHLAVDRSGTHLLVANYTGGTLAVLPLERDGSLGAPTQVVQHKGSSINTARQRSPHAHSIDLDADNRFAISADLGADRLFIYRYDTTGGGLSPGLRPAIAATPGAGPRHFAFHPNGRFGFAINELASTITSYSWDAQRGALNTLATIPTLPAGFGRESSTAEIRLHPTGRFLYGSNRGHDSIAVYQVRAQQRLPDAGRARADARKNAPQLHHRPHRPVAHRGQPEQRHARRVPHQRPQRRADARGPAGESRFARERRLSALTASQSRCALRADVLEGSADFMNFSTN